MKADFPVQFEAVYCGKSGDSGSFKDGETNEVVSFAEAHAFDFESAEGNVQRLVMRADRIDQVAEGFNHGKLKRYSSRVLIEGNVVLNDAGRSFFRPVKITQLS
jgi:hypothetical protein